MKIHEFGFKTIEWIIECGDVKGIDRGCVECRYEQINGGVWSVVSGGEKREDERVVCEKMERGGCIRWRQNNGDYEGDGGKDIGVWKVLGKQHEHHWNMKVVGKQHE